MHEQAKKTLFDKVLALAAFALFLAGVYFDKVKGDNQSSVWLYSIAGVIVLFVGLRQRRRVHVTGNPKIKDGTSTLPRSDRLGRLGSWIIISSGSVIIITQFALSKAGADSAFLLIPLIGLLVSGIILSIISKVIEFRRSRN